MASIEAKIRKYCAYQERCQQEVRDKLYSEGLHKADVEQTIAALISEGYVNEERFAIAFARGKVRISHWGKIKITAALKQKKVSDYCIRKALANIEEDEYFLALDKVIRRYSTTLKEKDERKRNYRIMQHALGRGFEPDLIRSRFNIDD